VAKPIPATLSAEFIDATQRIMMPNKKTPVFTFGFSYSTSGKCKQPQAEMSMEHPII